MKNRDLSIGPYLVIAEPNGTGNVYENEDHVYHGDTFEEARAWAYESLGESPPEPEQKCERLVQSKPCNDCPFRRVAPAGWLGASTPEGFVATMQVDEEPLPCHKTVDYSRPDWHSRWTSAAPNSGKLCAGALILARNTGRVPRAAGAVVMPEVDRRRVFATFAEFVEHHRSGKVKSWTDPQPGTRELPMLNTVRSLIKLPPLGVEKPKTKRTLRDEAAGKRAPGQCAATVETTVGAKSFSGIQGSPRSTVPKACSRSAKTKIGPIDLCTTHARMARKGLVAEDGTVLDTNAIRDVRNHPDRFPNGFYDWQLKFAKDE